MKNTLTNINAANTFVSDNNQLQSTSDEPVKLENCPPMNLQFREISFGVKAGKLSAKGILHKVSGSFKAGQLTAILGPSGSGKTTLLNALSGYKTPNDGVVRINGIERNSLTFRRICRYIMYEDIPQEFLTVDEAIMMAAHLKLNHDTVDDATKQRRIDKVLRMLRMQDVRQTVTTQLSGGERKRLSIALELISNPPILFLDEPTTGLDNVACSQCITLLNDLVENGHTVICSIHNPTARMFEVFHKVYVLSRGSCVYQGYGPDVVPFLQDFGLVCPQTYNPADFIIEVCNGAYGDYNSVMAEKINNGRCTFDGNRPVCEEFEFEFDGHLHSDDVGISEENENTFSWEFYIILIRMCRQNWRNKTSNLIKLILTFTTASIIAALFNGVGADGSRTQYNFSLFLSTLLFFIYMQLMPALSKFPTDVKQIKREHFNKWYTLKSYYAAMIVASIPQHLIMGTFYLSIIYYTTGQPMEYKRIVAFTVINFLSGFVSEGFSHAIGAVFDVTNSVFFGPALMAPQILLALYVTGRSDAPLPLVVSILMHFCYLTYSIEGLALVMFKDRPPLTCPQEVNYCLVTNFKELLKIVGVQNDNAWLDILALVIFYVVFWCLSYQLLKWRLDHNPLMTKIRRLGGYFQKRKHRVN